ncbi:MAG: 50S ribosomal protein L24 [Phycisphaerales bacterium]|nr:50S ribosomal protein L24 [Phycisphaerales bacterium]
MPKHVVKGDEVVITAGEYRGKTGTIVRVDTKNDRVIVHGSGIAGITKNIRPTRLNPEGGRVELDRSFHISNVSPVVDGKGSRVRFETKKDGSKVRVAAKGGKELGVVRSASAKGKKKK